MRDNKGEAKKIILPFLQFQGLKFHPMNQNPFLYLSDVFSIISWLKNINTALRDQINVSLSRVFKWPEFTSYVGVTKATKTRFSGKLGPYLPGKNAKFHSDRRKWRPSSNHLQLKRGIAPE